MAIEVGAVPDATVCRSNGIGLIYRRNYKTLLPAFRNIVADDWYRSLLFGKVALG